MVNHNVRLVLSGIGEMLFNTLYIRIYISISSGGSDILLSLALGEDNSSATQSCDYPLETVLLFEARAADGCGRTLDTRGNLQR